MPADVRIAETDDGAIVYDAARVGVSADPRWFDPAYWSALDATAGVAAGRGDAHFVRAPFGLALLRHYRRGGLVARFNRDRYLWRGAERTRAFREFRLLADARARGLPVPAPFAARFQRRGPWYRADILMAAIAGVCTLAQRVGGDGAGPIPWRAVGAAVGRVHAAGIWHADLNAHNILLDEGAAAWLIDFDRATRRDPERGWQQANLARLRRSLEKLGAIAGEAGFERDWAALLAGHAEATP